MVLSEDELIKEFKPVLDKIGLYCVDILKNETWNHDSWIYRGRKKHEKGVYNAGWTYEFDDDEGLYITVFNDGDNQTLTHLLEKGHLLVHGKKHNEGRKVIGYARGKKHIQPAYTKTKKKFADDLKDISLNVIASAYWNTVQDVYSTDWDD